MTGNKEDNGIVLISAFDDELFMWNSERNKPSPSCFRSWCFIISMITLTKTVLVNPNAMVSNLTFLPFSFRYCSILIKHSKGNKSENPSGKKNKVR